MNIDLNISTPPLGLTATLSRTFYPKIQLEPNKIIVSKLASHSESKYAKAKCH